jgi:diguanylate cyclase (GGDEF)-like protein/PAS domain S-box-containing protein
MEDTLRILVIDDDEVDRTAVKRTLKSAGLNVHIVEACNGLSGIALNQEHSFDCIFLDYKLPGEDGLTVLSEIRKTDSITPVIMLTGYGNECLAVDMMKAGATDYLAKSNMSAENLSHVLLSAVRISKAEQQIAVTEEKLRLAGKALESTSEGIIITDAEGRIETVNSAFYSITGYSPEEVIGQNPKILKSGLHEVDFYRKLWESLKQEGHWQGEIWNRRKNGELYPEWLSISSVKSEQNKTTNYVAIFTDITDRKLSEKRLNRLAHYDALTGLPNRLLFLDRMNQAFNHAHRRNQLVPILFLDLDRFKIINDTLGHSTGDLLLKEVAKRLSGSVKEWDTVSRFSGDKFVILLEDIGRIEAVNQIARKILNRLSKAFNIKNQELYISASIGISIYPNDGEDPDTLINNAEVAMYRAKEKGKNNFQMYAPVMNSTAFQRLVMENSLRKAVDKNELLLHYQPQIEVKTGRIVGVEALIRWQHQEMGLVYPGQFISLAEETGLIVPIGEWVLYNACLQNKKWQEAGIEPISISVNLSVRQFKDQSLFDSIQHVINETGLNPRLLDIEITETAAMHDAEYSISILEKLKDMGISISIDDFGTGYSSLNYLKQLPLDTLKIDKSFVHDIVVNEDDNAIVSAIIAMAHKLRLGVVAEGVETQIQFNFLQSLECDRMQGYLFSRPLPAEEFEQLISTKRELYQYKK